MTYHLYAGLQPGYKKILITNQNWVEFLNKRDLIFFFFKFTLGTNLLKNTMEFLKVDIYIYIY